MEATRNKENFTGYKNLTLYAKACALVVLVYKITKKFPKEELFGLTSQMRRCAVSIVANIVEGYGRRTPKDKLQFLYIARGSLSELECYIDLSQQLEYINPTEQSELAKAKAEVGKLLFGFMRSLETR
ncbi:MAG: four helix bundle protein [Candidatus Liptonbacteria bacterium]|nr:four helix bundle protein [Candidatus Liptonbacteria bacterium]